MIETPTSKNRLVEIAKQRFNEPTRQLVHFTGDIRIDDFLNDLGCYSHAYVLELNRIYIFAVIPLLAVD